MLFKRNSFIVLSVCLLFAQACRQKNESAPDFTLEHHISPQPPRVGQVTIILKMTDASGKPVTGARLRLEGHMSHAGMPPIFADAHETGNGGYSASMDLSMAGDWIVLVHAMSPDGRKLERHLEVKGVAP